MFSEFNIQEFLSAFIVLFAIIDIIGSVPIIINLQQRDRSVNALKASVLSFVLMLVFFLAGDLLLKLFHVDINSFALAGGIIIFAIALEMILDIEIFKNNGPIKEATLVPLVFPLLAGPGAFTTLLSLKAEFASINILLGLTANMIWVYIVLKITHKIQRILGESGIFIIRKFFGVILLAISVKLITSNISILIG
ncbi:MAG: MarC family protein [Muribaculaceae bacterium]|jgi:multiple antibiotic resistance protein|nr:MarC family protein [Muribaculaceae bacterium]MEE1337417.1 MarC family protein [Muribaculaceae bacterium]